MKINIKNCRNIKAVREGDAECLILNEGKLNILYGLNGVGKTTIVRAIRYMADGENAELYDSLKSFEYLKDPDNNCLAPEVSITEGIVRDSLVFDSSWVANNCFKSDSSLLDGAYKLCVDEEKLKELRSNRNRLCFELKGDYGSLELKKAIEAAGNIVRIAGALKTGLAKNSKLAGALQGGGPLDGLPPMLASVVPEETAEKAEWATWHYKGASFVSDDQLCPYCGTTSQTIQDVVAFDKHHNLEQAKAWLDVLRIMDEDTAYFANENTKVLCDFLQSGMGDEDALEGIKDFASVLCSTVDAFRSVGEIVDAPLEGPSCPTERQMTNYATALNNGAVAFSPRYANLLKKLASKVIALKDSIDSVKSIDDAWKKTLCENSDEYCSQMSEFLSGAGYPYSVVFENKKKGKEALVLVHRATGLPVRGSEISLSYGEQNALSLALFYSEAIKRKDALIILDDPISSFDGVKRFALLGALFSKKGNRLLGSSLNGRFVVMLTHDPLVVHDSLRFLANRGSTCSKYLFTDANGDMIVKSMGANDFQPCIKLIDNRICEYARQSDDPLPFCTLVYLRQRFELSRKHVTSDLFELVKDGYNVDDEFEHEYKDTVAFSVLSSLLHGDSESMIRKSSGSDGEIEMPDDILQMAESAINDLLIECGASNVFCFERYRKLLTEEPSSYIIDFYQNKESSPYEKLLAVRTLSDIYGMSLSYIDPYHEYVINGAFHLGGDLVMQLDRDEFCHVPVHIQQVCDEVFRAITEQW